MNWIKKCGIIVAGVMAMSHEVMACACCADKGFRYVETEHTDGHKLEIIKAVRFGKTASLYTGEREPADIVGIEGATTDYRVSATWIKDHLTLHFTSMNGMKGGMTLTLPQTVSIAMIDTRDRPLSGNADGVTLYKEWKLTSPFSASGMFTPSRAQKQKLTLILQGRGNGCTSAEDFHHWTIVVSGPRANFTIYGDLDRS